MVRSLQKAPYIAPSLIKKDLRKDRPIQTWARGCFILPEFIGFIFQVHQGKAFVRFQVTEDMVGTKLGEYALTRKANIFKKKQKKK
jgi:ribosomal protein S19